MRENGGNKFEVKKAYTKPTLTAQGKGSEFTPVGKTKAKNGGSAKRPYTKPTLTTYGTIRDLTKMVGPKGPSDGGSTVNFTQSQV